MTPFRTNKSLAAAVIATALAISVPMLQAQYHDDHHDSHHDDHRGGSYDHGRADYHFRGDSDRAQFAQHYRNDARRWHDRHDRPSFRVGESIPRTYAISPVPTGYYRGVPPPPPGYRFGYYDGYVVAYNPTTRIIADVLDLATGNY